jgi:hypothetical protein
VFVGGASQAGQPEFFFGIPCLKRPARLLGKEDTPGRAGQQDLNMQHKEKVRLLIAPYTVHRIREVLDTGWISMRRASGRANWFRCDDAPAAAEVPGPCLAVVRPLLEQGFLEPA